MSKESKTQISIFLPSRSRKKLVHIIGHTFPHRGRVPHQPASPCQPACPLSHRSTPLNRSQSTPAQPIRWRGTASSLHAFGLKEAPVDGFFRRLAFVLEKGRKRRHDVVELIPGPVGRNVHPDSIIGHHFWSFGLCFSQGFGAEPSLHRLRSLDSWGQIWVCIKIDLPKTPWQERT